MDKIRSLIAFILLALSATFSANQAQTQTIDAERLGALVRSGDYIEAACIIKQNRYEIDSQDIRETAGAIVQIIQELDPTDFISLREAATAVFIIRPNDSGILQIAVRAGVDFNSVDGICQRTQIGEPATEVVSEILDEINTNPISVIDLINNGNLPNEISEEDSQAVERSILDFVRPIPARLLLLNRDGYEALLALDPNNQNYLSRYENYRDQVLQAAVNLRNVSRQDFDEFRNVTRFYHLDQPFYTDTRTYIAPYIVEGQSRRALRIRLNYTADRWLFIRSAEIRIDGEVISFPDVDWRRDNDSEIWEWIDWRADDRWRHILLRIVASRNAIIRFNGSQYHENYRITATDRQVIHDMLLQFEHP